MRLTYALAGAVVAGVLTALMSIPSVFGPLAESPLLALYFFLVPGLLISELIGGGAHVFSMAVATLVNAIFYFGAVYIALTILERHRAKIRREMEEMDKSSGL